MLKMEPGINVSDYLQPEENIQAVWFNFLNRAKVKLRYLSPKKLRALRREATVREFRDGVLEEFLDEEYFLARLTDEVILDWEGFFDDKGKAVPCNSMYKQAFMENWGEFSLFIQNISVNLEEYRLAKKNYKRTADA